MNRASLHHLTAAALLLLTSASALAQTDTAPQSPAPAADAEPAKPISHIVDVAQRRLNESTAELARLREQHKAEEVPLARELEEAEKTLLALRERFDQLAKNVDRSSFDIAAAAKETKQKQDELTYISTILDEYARNFETKINVSELQYCGEAIEAAKSAMENTALSDAERFDRQLALVTASQDRIDKLIGGMRFPGVGVDLEGSITQGQYAIIGPVALFKADSGDTAGVVLPQATSTNPLIRPLEGSLQVGLAALVASGEGLLPFDPSKGGALKQLIQKTNLIHIFHKGGPIMWPILASSIIAVAVVIERVLFLMLERARRSRKTLDRFFTAVSKGDIVSAIDIAKRSKFYVVRALGYALAHRETSLESALLYAQAKELKRYQRGIPVLDTIITLAPLLGLLGTVTGMMGSFAIIGGDLSSPGAITGGIAEALIATAAGLGIAITCLLPFNFLNARTEDARHELESASTQLELMIRTQAAVLRVEPKTHPSTTVAAPASNGTTMVHA